MTAKEYEARFGGYIAEFEKRLARIADGWHFAAPLAESMRYSLFSGGKRLRPVLLLATYEAFGGVASDVPYLFAAAVETLHTYSLVHDDLPCMDDDDFRRGKPTSHKVFGEDVAVLTGDALLNMAFELVFAAIRTSGFDPRACLAGEEFASRTGAGGLIGGQAADLKFGGGEEELDFVYKHKTCDLFVAAAKCGALLAGASDGDLAKVVGFATDFGFAFQLADDLLDGGDEGCTALKVYPEAQVREMLAARSKSAAELARGFGSEFLAETALRAEKRRK